MSLLRLDSNQTAGYLNGFSHKPLNELKSLLLPQERYVVETKIGGRTVGSTLYLVSAKSRDGSQQQVVEGQSFKLFLASSLYLVFPAPYIFQCELGFN